MDRRQHTIKVRSEPSLGKNPLKKAQPAVFRSGATGFLEIYDRLYSHFGPQDWWPADSPFEVIVGAILTQNTAWTNVEKAIAKLREHQLLSLKALSDCPKDQLTPLIRSSGYFNQKARRLKETTRFIFQHYGGSLDQMFAEDAVVLRKALLSVKGLGPETVDSILLYAGEKPVFVVDAYTRRIFSRHHLVEEKDSYSTIQEQFMEVIPSEAKIFNEYHALIVKTAKIHCKKKPDCSRCPLRVF